MSKKVSIIISVILFVILAVLLVCEKMNWEREVLCSREFF